MKEQLEELRKNAILEVTSSWGLGCPPGTSGTIITNDKKIYAFHSYVYLPDSFKKNNVPQESLVELRELTDNEYQKVISFIEHEIVGKDYDFINMYDVSYHVRGTFNEKKFNISNSVGENGLQEKADKLIKEMKGKK